MILVSLMILAYLAMSAFINIANCSGLEMKGAIPWLLRFSLKSGAFSEDYLAAPGLPSTAALTLHAGTASLSTSSA